MNPKQNTILLTTLGAALLSFCAYGQSAQSAAIPEEDNMIIGQCKTRGTESPIIVDVTLKTAGELSSAVESNLMEVDSLVVRGPINDADFKTMWEAGRYEKLKRNLTFPLPSRR